MIPIFLTIDTDAERRAQIHYGDMTTTEGGTLTLHCDLPGRARPVLVDVKIRQEGEPEVPCTLERLLVWLEERGLPDVTRADALAVLRIYNGVEP